MVNSSLLEALSERPLLSDGAMGTQLQQAGLEPGGCGEAWNLDAPDRVVAIQRRYVEAGSDCLITNTFGGSRIMLERHGQEERTAAINAAAVDLARRAFGDRPGWVLGDIGPFGGLLEPYGETTIASVEAAFGEQAEALVSAGADAIIVETQTSLEELGIGRPSTYSSIIKTIQDRGYVHKKGRPRTSCTHRAAARSELPGRSSESRSRRHRRPGRVASSVRWPSMRCATATRCAR